MKIASAYFYTTSELMARLKKVVMLHDRSVKPYENAEIQITDIGTDLLHPAQLYVLRSEFDKVRDLRWSFMKQYGVDILRLPDYKAVGGKLANNDSHAPHVGFIEFTVEGPDGQPGETISLLPPVIEGWLEADKSAVNIINDGMHRCFTARTCRVVPAVVKIAKIRSDLPYYAYPLPDGWRDVKMVDSLSGNLLKKYHRFPEDEYKKYYRDFSSVFPGCGGPRGHGETPRRVTIAK